MIRHKDASKRERQNVKRRDRNRAVRSEIRTLKKDAVGALLSKSEDSDEKLKFAQKKIDQAVRKGVLHRKTASRYVSRLAKRESASSASSKVVE